MIAFIDWNAITTDLILVIAFALLIYFGRDWLK